MYTKNNSITGLVLAGGQSSRMGQNKAHLVYHQTAQYQVVFNHLSQFCQNVFISCKKTESYPLPCIYDHESLGEIGPAAGLISAYSEKKQALFTLAVDYPLLIEEDIQRLYEARDSAFDATVFYNQKSGYFEPLIGIYELSFLKNLSDQLAKNNNSLQALLKKQNIKKFVCKDVSRFESIDTPSQFQKLTNHKK